MKTHLDILERLLSRAHDTDCPLYKEKGDIAACTCAVKIEVQRLRDGLVPWAPLP